MNALTKSFGSQTVLDDVSLDLSSGEVVALLGQNGSGKSTLVKLLAGVYIPDRGHVEVGGVGGAGHGALHFIHQDLGLIPSLSTVENLSLPPEESTLLLLPHRRRRERVAAVELIRRFGVDFDVTVPVARLTPAQRSIVAIARAMSGWGDEEDNVLVLDEPTASLHGEEVNVLLDAVREVARRGAAVLFISHRLDEVTALADRVVVLRDGVKVHDGTVDGLDVSAMATLITGAEVSEDDRRPVGDRVDSEPVLSLRGLVGGGIRGLDLDVRAGEVIGVAGSLGSGRENLAGLVFGAISREAGEVHIDGQLVSLNPYTAVRSGIALVPSDRHARGAVMHHSVRENVVLPLLRPLARLGIHLRRRHEHRDAHHWASKVELRPMEPERPMLLFSGGNQQKVVVARALRTEPKLLLVEEPTHGVDVGAAESVRSLILTAAEQGAAVLVTSSDNADLIRMCAEVIVMRDGRPVARLVGPEINDHRLTLESLGADLGAGPNQPKQELKTHV